ncbi:serine/Arginine-related protein 53-like [Palaemon carinicauda]|uniref:serine/Arginine-related protein 53-like n=1 Tax=Palaemon carinicauda TaxID=392227 RepID=UPI0035B5C022
MEEDLSGCFTFVDHPFTPPAPSTAVPEEFLQPSTSGTQQVLSKAPSVARTRFHGRSESSADESSVSSDEERCRRRRRKRDRSRRRRSFSRSPKESRYRRRRSRSPQKKCRRAESPQERWILVPESKLRDLSSVSGSVVRLTGDSPPRRASDSRKSASASDRKASSGRHKSRSKETQSAQRRESPPRTGSLDELARGVDRRVRVPPSNTFTEEPVPLSKALKVTGAPVSPEGLSRGSRQSGGARAVSSPHRRMEDVVEEGLSRGSRQSGDARAVSSPHRRTEDSAYRRVISLIRSHNKLVEPLPQEEDDWTSGLNRIMEEPVQRKLSLALPEARDVKLGRAHIDKVVTRNGDNSKGHSSAKLLQGLKSQSKYYAMEGRPHGASKLEDVLEVLGQGAPEDRAATAPIFSSQSESIMMEEMSKDLVNVTSWLDWWATTLVGTVPRSGWSLWILPSEKP